MNNCLLLLSCEGSRTLPPAMPEPLLSSSFLFYYFRVVLVVYIIILSFNISSQPQEPSPERNKKPDRFCEKFTSFILENRSLSVSSTNSLSFCNFQIDACLCVCEFLFTFRPKFLHIYTHIPLQRGNPSKCMAMHQSLQIVQRRKISQAQIPQEQFYVI